MKLNKGALELCAVYTVYCFGLLGLGSYGGNFKGQLVLNSLAYLPALLPFSLLDLHRFVRPESWINNVFFFYPASARGCLLVRRSNQRHAKAVCPGSAASHRRRPAGLASSALAFCAPELHRNIRTGFMNLTGSRPTLIANVCALVIACVVIAEGAYIVHAHYGYYMPQDAPFFLFPALAMFIIRNRKFSFFFLILYIALVIQMFVQAQSLYPSGPVQWHGKWGPLQFLPLFFLLSVFSLVGYAVHAFVRLAISRLARLLVPASPGSGRRRPHPVGIRVDIPLHRAGSALPRHAVAWMETTGRREAPPDGAIRGRSQLLPGLRLRTRIRATLRLHPGYESVNPTYNAAITAFAISAVPLLPPNSIGLMPSA